MIPLSVVHNRTISIILNSPSHSHSAHDLALILNSLNVSEVHIAIRLIILVYSEAFVLPSPVSVIHDTPTKW